MKFLHCSDIHLGRRPVGARGEYSNKRFEDYFNAFKNVVEDAVNKKIDAFIIAGDLFDRKELVPEVLEKTEKILSVLKENKIPLVLIEGNHDNIVNGKEFDSWIIYLEKKEYLKRPYCYFENDKYHFVPIDVNGYKFYGCGYPGSFVNETLKELSKELKKHKNDKNIIMVHTAISSGDFLPGTVEKETIDVLSNKCLYIAGGHFHSFNTYPKEDPFFFIPGSLEYWDVAEASDAKGYIIFDTDTREYKFYPATPRNKIEINISTQCSNFSDFKNEFIFNIDKYNFIEKEDIVFVKIKLKNSFYIDTNWCEEYIASKGALKVIIKIKYPYQNIDKRTHSNIEIEEIEKELIKGWDFIGSKHEDFITSLKRLKIYQKEENEALFLDELDNLIGLIINDGE